MTARLESNIWKYTVILVTNKRVWTAIIGAYYLTLPGVTPHWIGFFLLAASVTAILFDIPSSYIADKIGHKYALVLDRVFLLLSSAIYLLTTNVIWLLVAAIFFNVGVAFGSGVGSAFLHETLRGLGREDEYRTVAGKASSIGFFLPALLAVVVPFAVSISYKIPFLIGLVFDIIGLVVSLSLVPPPVASEHVAKVQGTRFFEVVRQGLALRFFRIAVFSGIVSALLDGIDWFRGPYQLTLGVPVIWFGVFFGTGRVLASLMLAYSGKIHKLIGDVYAYQRAQIVIYGLLLIIMGTVSAPWVVVAVFMLDNGLQWGMSQVDTGYLLDIIRDHKFKATLLSISNQLENLFSIAVVVTMGYAIEAFGYQHSFAVLAGLFFLIVAPLHFWIYQNRRTN